MGNILSSLNGLTETWLTLGSASYHIDLNYILLSGLGLLLLYIWYLIWRLIQLLWRKENTPKRQTSIRRHKRKAFKRKRTSQSDPEEGRKLQTILQSTGKPYDPTGFRQLLCPNPLCNICNKASARVSHLLSQAPPEDSAAVTSLPSIAPITEVSLAIPSHFPANRPGGHPAPEAPPHTSLPILSETRITPLHGLSPPTPLSTSLSPQTTVPVNPAVLLAHTPRRTLASSPHLLPNASQEAQLALQEVPQSSVKSPGERSPSVSTAKSTAYHPASSRPRLSAEDQSLTNLSQQLLESYAQGSYQRPSKAHAVDSGDHLSPSPDVLALFKKQEKGDTDATVYKLKREKTVSCLMPPNTLGKTSASRAGLENPDGSHPLGMGKPGSPHLPQQPSHPKTSKDQSESKDILLFWGLPSLHSKSLEYEGADSSNSYPGRDYFNKITKASTGSDASNLTYPTPLPLPGSDQQGQIVPQSQIKPDSLANSKAQTQSLTQFLPPSTQSQLRICGVRFHSLKDEAQSLTPREIQQLEYNLLQKALQSFLGLPTLIPRFQEGFFPPPPKIFSTRSSSKVHAPKTILPGDFPFSHTLERKLEHHLQKRLIQRRWGLPQRIRDSWWFMSPQSEIPEVTKPRGSHGLSWISLYKFNANRNLPSFGVSQAGSFYRKPLEIPPLKEKGTKVQRQCPGIDQRDRVQGNSSGATKSSVHSNSKTDPELQPGNMSGKISKASWVKECQKECETFLQEHVGKDTDELSGGETPGALGRSGHSMSRAQPPAEASPRQMAPSAGEEDALTKHPHSLSSKEKMLEKHITAFGRRMALGLPQRVEESVESKAEPSLPFPQQHVRAHGVSGADSDKSSRFLHRNTPGDRMGTVNSVPTQQRPLPATSPVGHSQPASENKKVCVDKDLSTAPRGREPPRHWRDSVSDKGALRQSEPDNRPGPELPMSPSGPTHERLASSTHTQGSQGEKKSWEDGSVAEGSMRRHKGEQLPGPHPQSTKILKSTQGLCSPGSHVIACQSLQGMSVPHSSETPDSKSQVSTEVLPNSEGGTHIQGPDLPAMPFAPEEMTSKPQGPSSGAMTVSQVLHVHLPTVGINMASPQGPWVPAYVSGQRKNKDCPPASRELPPLATEAGKLGGGVAGLGASQTRGKRPCVQARAPEETQGHTSSPALTPKSQPQETQLTSQVRGFWQRLSPGRKHKGQQSLAKGCSPSTSVKGTSLIKGRREFCGNTEAQKCVRDPGMVLRKQLGYRHGTVTPCLQAPVSPLMGSEEAQEEQLQAQAEPVQRLPHFGCKAPCSQGQRAESCSPGQGQPAPERCGTTGKAKRVESSPVHASPPKSYL